MDNGVSGHHEEMILAVVSGLQDRALTRATVSGFRDLPKDFATDMMLIVTEIGEATEEDRAGKPAHYYNEDSPKPEGWAVELVDAWIRILEVAAFYKVNLGPILLEKMAYNETRPYRHGGKRY